jgi:acetyltransferase-like isoleucine patch superfamily enzyme
MNQKERRKANLPYKAWLDGLDKERLENKKRLYKYNHLSPKKYYKRTKLLKDIFGSCGEQITVEEPFHCDYGKNIYIGENFFANYNLIILDVGKVMIGENVQMAPNVSLYTSGHPIHKDSRNSGYEYGIDISIGDSVWIGGNSVILPGVHVGNNVVIGAGTVVKEDIPDNFIAIGNPCKLIREITEDDRKYYFKKREFDVSDYK